MKVNVDTNWKTISNGWVYTGGTWEQFWPTGTTEFKFMGYVDAIPTDTPVDNLRCGWLCLFNGFASIVYRDTSTNDIKMSIVSFSYSNDTLSTSITSGITLGSMYYNGDGWYSYKIDGYDDGTSGKVLVCINGPDSGEVTSRIIHVCSTGATLGTEYTNTSNNIYRNYSITRIGNNRYVLGGIGGTVGASGRYLRIITHNTSTDALTYGTEQVEGTLQNYCHLTEIDTDKFMVSPLKITPPGKNVSYAGIATVSGTTITPPPTYYQLLSDTYGLRGKTDITIKPSGSTYIGCSVFGLRPERTERSYYKIDGTVISDINRGDSYVNDDCVLFNNFDDTILFFGDSGGTSFVADRDILTYSGFEGSVDGWTNTSIRGTNIRDIDQLDDVIAIVKNDGVVIFVKNNKVED